MAGHTLCAAHQLNLAAVCASRFRIAVLPNPLLEKLQGISGFGLRQQTVDQTADLSHPVEE